MKSSAAYKLTAATAICFWLNFVSAQKKELPVKVLEATARSWVSGAPGGKAGTDYKIKILIKTGKPIAFENLWLKDENMNFDIEFFTLQTDKELHKGDSVLLAFSKTNNDLSTNSNKKKLPFKYSGKALIETKFEGKPRYFYIKTFSKLVRLAAE